MPVALPFDSRDAMPEAIRDYAVEKDGKFIFEAEPVSVVNQINDKLKKLRGDLDVKSSRLGRYAKLEELEDFDADEYLALREQKRAGKPLTADEKAELERIHGKTVEKLKGESTQLSEKLKAYESELKRYKLTDPIRAIATSEKVGMFAEDFDLAWTEINSRFRLVEEDGKKPRIVVLDEDGDATDIKIEDFFTKLYKAQRPKFFKASGAGGSGAPSNTGGGGTGKALTRSAFNAMNPADQSKFFRDGGQLVEG